MSAETHHEILPAELTPATSTNDSRTAAKFSYRVDPADLDTKPDSALTVDQLAEKYGNDVDGSTAFYRDATSALVQSGLHFKQY